MVIGQRRHLTHTWQIVIGQENISFAHLHKSPSLSYFCTSFENPKSYLNKTLYTFILFFTSSRNHPLQILLLLSRNPRSSTWILDRPQDRQESSWWLGFTETRRTPNDRSRWVPLLTKTSNILSILVLIDHVTLCYKNPILSIQNNHHKIWIFSQTTAYFRTSVDRPYGGSRPICTIVHKFELAVDRSIDQSTG